MILISCRTIKPSDFVVKDTTPALLPTLEPEANMDNLENVISSGNIKITGIIEYTKATYSLVKVDYDLTLEYIPEKRIYDILKVYASEVKNNIIDTTSQPYGSIQLDLISFNEKRNIFLTFFSLWTLCVPSLIGIPISSIKTELEIQITICDINKNVIKKYKGAGTGLSYIAMYWGYGEDAWRKSAIEAFKDAMKDIRTQIIKDKDELKSKLLKSKN